MRKLLIAGLKISLVSSLNRDEVPFNNLSVNSLPESLFEDGYFILSNSINSNDIYRLAKALTSCIEKRKALGDSLSERRALDGSIRSTIATRPNESLSECDQQTNTLADYFKAQTQLIGEKVADIFDVAIYGTSASEPRLAKLVRDPSSDTLDHFHVYSPPIEITAQAESDISVPFHYDKGLFLVLTPEIWVSDSSHSVHHELIVRRRDGTEIKVKPSNPDSTIILIGQSMTDWLHPSVNVKPCLHAVRPLQSSQGEHRVVLARMFLPNMATVSDLGIVFRDFFRPPSNNEQSPDTKLQHWRRLTESECDENSKMCWMQCVPDIDCGGAESVCRDPVEDRDCVPDECNERCALMCPEPDPALVAYATVEPLEAEHARPAHVVPFKRQTAGAVGPRNDPSHPAEGPRRVTAVSSAGSGDRFCYGATSMVMSGFQSVTADNANCIILFFRPWLLNTPLKFAMGCIGVFLLGVLIEAAIMFRRHVTNEAHFPKKWIREGAITSLFALNVTLGYLAMLAAMTFNVELFISTVMGLAVGHVALGNSQQPVRESADACCVTSEAAPNTALGVNTTLRNSTGACCCDK